MSYRCVILMSSVMFRINGNFFEIDDVYGVADANYYVIDVYEE